MLAYCRYTTARSGKQNDYAKHIHFFRTHGMKAPLLTARFYLHFVGPPGLKRANAQFQETEPEASRGRAHFQQEMMRDSNPVSTCFAAADVYCTSGETFCRAAGNRTRSLRTRSVCTTGILRPDKRSHPKTYVLQITTARPKTSRERICITRPRWSRHVVTNIPSPSLGNFSTLARGRASLRDIAAPCTKSRKPAAGQVCLSFVHPAGFEPATFRM